METLKAEQNTLRKMFLRAVITLLCAAPTFAQTVQDNLPATRAVKPSPLRLADPKLFEAGKAVYNLTCIACHRAHGLGEEGLAPPLVDSEWIAGNGQRLVRIVLNGLRGPLLVKERKYDLDMPALGVLEDQQIADVLTYVRNEWGHEFPPVKAELVKGLRAQFGSREDAWTQDELLKVR